MLMSSSNNINDSNTTAESSKLLQQQQQQPAATTTDNNNVMAAADSLEFLSTICGSLKNIKRTGWVRSGVPLPESDADHMHRCAMCAMLVTTQPPHPDDDYTSSTTKLFHPDHIDGGKLLKMAVTHDLCESLAGDVTPFCDKRKVDNKYDVEKRAMEAIRCVVGDPLGKDLFDLWKEYEEQQTPEALLCKDIDKFEMVMQAYEYEKAYLKHDHNGATKQQQQQDDLPLEEEESSFSYNSSNNQNNNHNNSDGILSSPLRTFFVTTQNKMQSPLFRRLDKELRAKREKLLNERGWDVTPEEK